MRLRRRRSGPRRVAYGEHRLCHFDVWADPPGADAAIVVVHGGFWKRRYRKTYGEPLAADLVADPEFESAFVANLEYRAVGDLGGGYPGTTDDVAAGLARALEIAGRPSSLVVIGHSAGGHLALWAATSPTAPQPTMVVAQAAVSDLGRAESDGLGDGAVRAFMGGPSSEMPESYRVASPIEHDLGAVEVLYVHGRSDSIVPSSYSTAMAERRGGHAMLVAGGHFEVIDPADPSWLETKRHIADHIRSRHDR